MMNLKNVSLVSIAAVLVALSTIWNFKDNFVDAGDFNAFKQEVETLTTNQAQLNNRLDQHLTLERQQLIFSLEERLEELYKMDQNDPAVRAKIKKTSTQLEVLYGQQ